MKALIVAGALSLAAAGISGEAAAACAAPSVRVNTMAALNLLLTGQTVCVPAVTVPNMTWQELHQAGGALVDYKRGPTNPVDPSETVGTWSLSGTDSRAVFVVHNYGGGGTYTYSVWANSDGTHSFCGAGVPPEIVAKIKPAGAC